MIPFARLIRLALPLLVAALAGLVAGCAAPRPQAAERIVLLPNADGRSSAVIVTRRDGQAVTLSQPWAGTQVSRTAIVDAPASEAELRAKYGTLLSVQPPSVRSFTLYFEYNRAVLTAASQRDVDLILAEAATAPAAEIDIVGHTDAKGSTESNDVLGRSRAAYVAQIMQARGFSAARLSVQSRGKREPLVVTPDGAEEPRNRRVEIRLR